MEAATKGRTVVSVARTLRDYQLSASRAAVLRWSFQILQILHFEPSLDALSVRSDVTSSTKILSAIKSCPQPNMAHIRQSRPASGFGFQVKDLKLLKLFLLRSGTVARLSQSRAPSATTSSQHRAPLCSGTHTHTHTHTHIHIHTHTHIRTHTHTHAHSHTHTHTHSVHPPRLPALSISRRCAQVTPSSVTLVFCFQPRLLFQSGEGSTKKVCLKAKASIWP